MQCIVAFVSATQTQLWKRDINSLIVGRGAQQLYTQFSPGMYVSCKTFSYPVSLLLQSSLVTQVEFYRDHVAIEGFRALPPPALLGATHLGPFSYNELRRTVNFCTWFSSWQFRFLAGVVGEFQKASVCQQLLTVHFAGLDPSSTST